MSKRDISEIEDDTESLATGTTADEGADFERLLRALAATPKPRPPAVDLTGRQIGPFVVEELLGRGGMGEVWKARDPRLKRYVALKVLVKGGRAERALLDEARAAAAVHHPRIATVFEVSATLARKNADGDDESDLGPGFIALEYVDGPTLRRLLRRGPLDVADVVRIAREIAEGLAAVHARGLIHRDIKPENIALDENGNVKLLDFGIAVHEPTAAYAGTPRYMSPEQRRGDAVDARCDVFAFGAVVVELLAGRSPWNDDGVLRREQNGDALLRVKERGDVPTALVELLRACLATAAANRPASGAALLSALPALSSSSSSPTSSQASPQTSSSQTSSPSASTHAAPTILATRKSRRGRRRMMAAVAAAAVVVAVAVVIGIVVLLVTPRLPPSQASVPVVSSKPRVQERFKAAVAAVLEGDFAGATAPLIEVVKAEPKAAWAWALLLCVDGTSKIGVTREDAQKRAIENGPPAQTLEGRELHAIVDVAVARTVAGPQGLAPDAPAVDEGLAVLEEAWGDWVPAAALVTMLPWRTTVDEKLARIDRLAALDHGPALPDIARVQALARAGRRAEAKAAADAGLVRHPGNNVLESFALRESIITAQAQERARGIQSLTGQNDEALDKLEARLDAFLQKNPDDLEANFMRASFDFSRRRYDQSKARVLAILDGPFQKGEAARAVALTALSWLGHGRAADGAALLQAALARLAATDRKDTAAALLIKGGVLLVDLGKPKDAVTLAASLPSSDETWKTAKDVVDAVAAAHDKDITTADNIADQLAARADHLFPSEPGPARAQALVNAEIAGVKRQEPLAARAATVLDDDATGGLAGRMRARVVHARALRDNAKRNAESDRVLDDADACAKTELPYEQPCRVAAVEAALARGKLDVARRLWPDPDADLPLAKPLAGSAEHGDRAPTTTP